MLLLGSCVRRLNPTSPRSILSNLILVSPYSDDVSDYQNRLMSFIKRAEQAIQAAKEEAVRAEGLTAAQYNVLLVLSHSPAITGSELARRCCVTAQTMSSVLARLMDRGLVSRTAHPRHKGVLEVTVTPSGQQVLELTDRRVEKVEATLTRALEPEEQNRLRDLLTRCVAAVGRTGRSGEEGHPVAGRAPPATGTEETR